MKIFVTGGSGFVGQNVIPVLIQNGYEVLALVRSEPSAEKVRKIGAVPVTDELTALSESTEHALKQCQVVLHAAAHMDFTYDPKPFYTVNVEATRRLLKLSKEAGVRRFIYLSAAPVVPGSPVINLQEEDAGHDLPKSLYPKTKAIAEKAVLAANSKDFKTLSLRPPAIWGPNNHHYEMLLDNVRAGKWRWIGGSHQTLSTIHVKNLASAMLSAIRSELGGEAFFVTDGDRRSMRTTFGSIIKAHDLDPGDKELPRGVAVFMAHFFGAIWKLFRLKSRPPVAPLMIRLMASEFSISDLKARTKLEYKNVISFEQGIQELKWSLSKGADS